MADSLGQRCVDWCLEQASAQPVPTLRTLATWFAPCERRGQLLGLDAMVMAGTRLNHCAATQCFAAIECARDDDLDIIPHRPRAAAKELRADAIDAGVWHQASEAVSGVWLPSPGDLAIYDRSQPGRPETAWWGHVDRVVRVLDETRYENIGANEGPGGAWRQEATAFTHPKLLGFVAYPHPKRADKPVHLLGEDEVRHIKALVSRATVQAEAAWWEVYEEDKRHA